MSASACNPPRISRPGIFEWTGLQFLRPSARPSMSALVAPMITGFEAPYPLVLPLGQELPSERASLLEIGEFIARFDPTRHFREHWGERYREQISTLWNDCVITYRDNREAT